MTNVLENIAAVKLISNLLTIKGVSFVGLNYTNQDAEKSRYLLNIGVSYAKAKESDIQSLGVLNISSINTYGLDSAAVELLDDARKALIASFIKPNKAMSEAQKNSYTVLTNSMKIHNTSGDLHIFAMKVSKTVEVKGNYKPSVFSFEGAKPLTRAKNMLRLKYCKTGQYRQFKVGYEQIHSAKLNGTAIEFQV